MPDPPLVRRRPDTSGRATIGVFIGLGLGLAIGLVLLFVARGGSGSPKSTSATPEPGSLAFTVSGTDVQALASPTPGFPADVRAKVLETLNRYLTDAVAGPLRSGRPAGDLAPVFTAPALARVNGPDRAALVDEGLPKASNLRAEAAKAKLGILLGDQNRPQVVSAEVDLRVTTGGSDTLTVVRTGALVLVPAGGGWKIDGYDINTARDSADGPTTTSARR